LNLEDLGYNQDLKTHRKENDLDSFEIGRVILEHKERYVVKTSEGEYDTELIGNLRFTAESRYDFPAVGDWVAFMEYDEGKGLIQVIYPRKSILERKAVGKSGQVQIIATNVDVGLIVQAASRDFNLNRLERYLTVCNTANVSPAIVLSKVDLLSDTQIQFIKLQIKQRLPDVPVLSVSSESIGYKEVDEYIETGKTYCLLGSSGVGKSTLLNGLQGEEEMKTGEISSAVHKGKHTTSHRELILMKNGGILIDNPGMREIGVTDSSEGLNATFENIIEFAQDCRFSDCTHTNENGCAILDALKSGEIDHDSFANFKKLEKEQQHFESDVQDRKKKSKDLGKVIKNFKKQRKNNKF
jgi:ribosome biogenesis GTPase